MQLSETQELTMKMAKVGYESYAAYTGNKSAVTGDVEKVTQTTTDKDTKQMTGFMDAIDRYCIERLSLYLPVPGMEGFV